MGPLSLNTIGLFLALAPGFFFLLAFYVAGSIPRRSLRSSPTAELAVLATLSLFAHLLFGGFYAVVIAPSLFEVSVLGQVLDLVLARPPEPPVAAEVEPAWALAIGGYAVFVCGLSALGGAALINAVECGIGPFRGLARAVMARWLYDAFVRPAGRRGIVFVSVLTNVTLGGRALVYEGVLEDIAYGGAQAIDYVELSAARRRLVAFDALPAAEGPMRAAPAAPVAPVAPVEAGGALAARLAIPAASIVDVVFRPVPVLLGAAPGRRRLPRLRRRS